MPRSASRTVPLSSRAEVRWNVPFNNLHLPLCFVREAIPEDLFFLYRKRKILVQTQPSKKRCLSSCLLRLAQAGAQFAIHRFHPFTQSLLTVHEDNFAYLGYHNKFHPRLNMASL